MKIKELIQRVQSLYSKGAQSDDSRLSSRHIYNKLLSVRARLLSQEAKKKQKISPWNYQRIPCIELVKVPIHECPCVPPLGCDILRSKLPLPKPLSGLSGELIKSVTSIDRNIKIDEISLNAVNSQRGNKYTSKKITYFIQDGYIYISTPSNLKTISITGLFEDPIAVEHFKGLCDDCDDCVECIDYLDVEFPIDGQQVDALIELCFQELISIFTQAQEDVTNNSIDSNKEQAK